MTRDNLELLQEQKIKAIFAFFKEPFSLSVGDKRKVDFVKIEYKNNNFVYSYMSNVDDTSSWQQGKVIASVEYKTANDVIAQLKMDKDKKVGNGIVKLSLNKLNDSIMNLKQRMGKSNKIADAVDKSKTYTITFDDIVDAFASVINDADDAYLKELKLNYGALIPANVVDAALKEAKKQNK